MKVFKRYCPNCRREVEAYRIDGRPVCSECLFTIVKKREPVLSR